jgi:hypothetical protein
MACCTLKARGLAGRPGSILVTLTAMLGLVITHSASGAFPEPAADSSAVPVSVDIRPGLCPNHLRIESPLTIPIAITARVDFEITQIDPVSVRLSRQGFDAELEPASWEYADVGTPVVGGLCACHKLVGDGIDDLEYQFPISDMVAAFGLGDCLGEAVELSVTGSLFTGEPIEGSDCALVISGSWKDEDLGEELCLLECPTEDATPGVLKFAYSTTVSDRVTFSIHDVGGEVVAVLNSMDMSPGIYTAIWDGKIAGSSEAPAGIYFARVSNSLTSDMRKVILSR